MTANPRRLSLQLTPLLDLLLIVIFAQYLDVRTTVKKEIVRVESSRDLVQAQLDEALQQLLTLKQQMLSLQDAAAESRARATEAERYRLQRDSIGEMVSEMFRVPDEQLQKWLTERRTNGPGPSTTDLAQVRTRWQKLMEGNSSAVVDHLLTFGELRKRVDLWDVYLQDDGSTRLTIGERSFTFRAESTEAFATQFYDRYKSLPEPKSMVLVMIAYGDAQFRLRKSALDGVPQALTRIRQDSGGRTRYEYAVLGFRPAEARTP